MIKVMEQHPYEERFQRLGLRLFREKESKNQPDRSEIMRGMEKANREISPPYLSLRALEPSEAECRKIQNREKGSPSLHSALLNCGTPAHRTR